MRYTIHPEARKEVLKRLLELNHAIYAEEVAQGLHDKGKAKKPKPYAVPEEVPGGVEEPDEKRINYPGEQGRLWDEGKQGRLFRERRFKQLFKNQNYQNMSSPIQRILFGSPGTGKSWQIDNVIIKDELRIEDNSNIIKTVFHPEYTYGDFMGKLMPISKKVKKLKRVEYNYYPGHFMMAIAKAYSNIIESHIAEDGTISPTPIKTAANVALVIDEINRGNSAAIFGTVFQLLDRERNGWSSYGINISELEYEKLIEEIGIENKSNYNDNDEQLNNNFKYKAISGLSETKKNDLLSYIYRSLNVFLIEKYPEMNEESITNRKIYIPPNLHIIATMNTSDSSIYYMDNAFKRRWDWEFVNIQQHDEGLPDVLNLRYVMLYGENKGKWVDLVDKLNKFITSNHQHIRKIEDKQIGYFFINSDTISEHEIKSKLMFFIWDSVFQNNKKPLVELLWGRENVREYEGNLVTFGQFSDPNIVGLFIDKILGY